MRVRHIIVISGITFAVGGAIWLYDNAGGATATGAGGLPLITANTTPIRTEPTEPGGEVIPHADSTIFAAMSRNQTSDPSMEGLKLPETSPQVVDDEPPVSADFAGLKTGFSLPTTPEPKVESLFNNDESEATDTANRYVSGISKIDEEAQAEYVPEKVTEMAPEPEPAPVKVEKPVVEKPVVKIEQPVVIEETPAPIKLALDQPGQAAQDMEAKEKQVLTASMPLPTEKPAQKPQPKTERTPEPVKEEKSEPTSVATASPKQLSPIVPPAKEPTTPPKTASIPKPNAAPALTPPRGMAPIIEQNAQIETGSGSAPVRPTTAPAPAPTAQPASTSDEYVIQLSSMPTRAEAERSWMQLTSMYPEALRGLQPSYAEAAIAGRGTFYRVRAGVTTRADANARCEQIRREDPRAGDCLVIRK